MILIRITCRALLALAIPLSLLLAPLPTSAAAYDACYAALNNNQPAEAVKEANRLLGQKKLPPETAYYANLCLGRAWSDQGELKRALPALQEAARLAATADQRCTTHSWLGSTLSKMGRLDEAEAARLVENEAAVEMGDASKEATALNNLASIAHARKQYDEALRLYTRSLALQTNEGAKATVLNNIALIHDDKGNYALAVDALQQAVVIDRRLGQQHELASHLLNLGSTYRKLQRWQDCGDSLREGLQLARALGDRYLEGMGLRYFAWAFEDTGDRKQAREHYNAALKIFREIGARGEVADVETSLKELGA